MVELVDTPDLGSGIARYVGSSPILGTLGDIFRNENVSFFFFRIYNESVSKVGPGLRQSPEADF